MKAKKVAVWVAATGLVAAAGTIGLMSCATEKTPVRESASLAERGEALKANDAGPKLAVLPPAPTGESPATQPGLTLGSDEELWIIPKEEADTQGVAAGTGGIDSFGSRGSARGGRAGRGAGGPGGFAGGGAGGGGGRGRGVSPLTTGQYATQAAPGLVGSGLLAMRQADGDLVTIPLKHTDVAASITGYIASVDVTQQFTNPYPEKIEATYVFPLPENAGVNEFVMTIGERHIRGIVRERAEAEQIYQQARAQGYQASLMTQERPNVFTQNVANIEPGKEIDISIRYFHTLAYKDGWFEWVFPMVVGPRYNPAGTHDGIGAIPRGAAGTSGQKTEVQYLAPNERSGHDIGLAVNLDAGVSIEALQSVNHKINEHADGEGHHVITLDAADSLPNKDFVLRWRVAGDKPKTAMFTQKDENGQGGYFTLMLVPPESLKNLPRRPVEMVFVVDTSGSMNGRPEAQAKQAVDVALQKMEPRDTFQVVKFASGAEQMAASPVIVSEESIAKARRYVASMEGDGGTEMLKGINASLGFPHDENRTRVVAFLTDGYIGNETQILKALHEQLERSRVFSFGVGSSPNRYLLDAMARVGHGTAAYLPLDHDAQPVMDAYFTEISHPALSQIRIDAGGTTLSEVFPQELPELFVGKPVIITGRYQGSVPRSITVHGVVGDEPVTYNVPIDGATAAHPAIATVWARSKITDLHDQAIYTATDKSADVKAVALEYGLMSEATSFVAVDSTHVTAGDHGTTVAVPVQMPDGVRYDTTVTPTGRERLQPMTPRD